MIDNIEFIELVKTFTEEEVNEVLESNSYDELLTSFTSIVKNKEISLI